MARDPDYDRISRKAHELWEADGRPHGKDQSHWDQAREIIAIEDSQGDTLLPRDTGAEAPIENAEQSLRNLADFPNLTDQGENLLTSTDREPTFGGGDGGMPSVEVPISDQPGVPSKSTASKKTVPKGASKPAMPAIAPRTAAAQPASVAKSAKLEAVRSKAPAKGSGKQKP